MSYVVARIGKPHGLGGEVTVRLHTDDPAGRFVVGARFATEAPRGPELPHGLTLRSARTHHGTWLLAFEEVADRTGAERLRGTHLLTAEELTRPTDDAGPDPDTPHDDAPHEDAWYEGQLVGLAVERPDGTAVGTVSGLRLGASQDLLEVALVRGGTAYIPFVTALVPVVDVRHGRVVVDPPAGLLELNA